MSQPSVTGQLGSATIAFDVAPVIRERPRFGYRRIGLMLRRDGIVANHKRVHRIYRDLGLQLRPRRKRGVRYVRGNEVRR